MIAGRDNHFYWRAVIMPILFMGLAIVGFAARSLRRRAVGGASHG